METKLLFQKINTLPLVDKKEVDDFVDFLLFKKTTKSNVSKKERIFGQFKDKIKIEPDFDEPLDDFKMV